MRIRSNSTLMGEALFSLEMTARLGGKEANAEWEIAVETELETGEARLAEHGPNHIEIFRFGPSCAVRMDSGSWFACTPPSPNGLGFAMVTGNEREQTHQLSVYLRTVAYFLDRCNAPSISALPLEVPA